MVLFIKNYLPSRKLLPSVFPALMGVMGPRWKSWLYGAEQNGYVLDGSVRGFAIAAPTDVPSPEEYITELQVPVKKAR